MKKRYENGKKNINIGKNFVKILTCNSEFMVLNLIYYFVSKKYFILTQPFHFAAKRRNIKDKKSFKPNKPSGDKRQRSVQLFKIFRIVRNTGLCEKMI